MTKNWKSSHHVDPFLFQLKTDVMGILGYTPPFSTPPVDDGD